MVKWQIHHVFEKKMHRTYRIFKNMHQCSSSDHRGRERGKLHFTYPNVLVGACSVINHHYSPQLFLPPSSLLLQPWNVYWNSSTAPKKDQTLTVVQTAHPLQDTYFNFFGVLKTRIQVQSFCITQCIVFWSNEKLSDRRELCQKESPCIALDQLKLRTILYLTRNISKGAKWICH